jgi:hypothetical protein
LRVEAESFEVEQFVVGNFAVEAAVLDGGGQLVTDGLDNESAAGFAEHCLVHIGVEMVLFELVTSGEAEQDPFGEQGFEDLGEVQDEGVALTFHRAVQEGDSAV